MTKTEAPLVPRVLYVRLSRDDPGSMSVDNQCERLLSYAPGSLVVIDRGVSGEINLTDPNTNWAKQVRPFLASNPGAQVVLFTLDRMGRKKGAMMFEAEKIIDAGGSIYCVRDDRLLDDMDDAAQAFEMMIGSYNADAQRVEGRKKTIAALEPMKEAEIPLGRKPELTEADLVKIRALHARGLGYASIGKVMAKKQKKDGKIINRSAALIKKALSGKYETREAHAQRDREKRDAMAARAVLGLSVRESFDAGSQH